MTAALKIERSTPPGSMFEILTLSKHASGLLVENRCSNSLKMRNCTVIGVLSADWRRKSSEHGTSVSSVVTASPEIGSLAPSKKWSRMRILGHELYSAP